MYRTILVPLDGSPFAEHALPPAAALARHSGATLHLVTVSTPLAETSVEGMYFSAAEVEQDLATRYRTYLEDVAKRLPGVKVRTDVPHGDAGTTLCALIHAEADLVVMATHGRGAFERFLLGSTTDEVVGHADKPILLVRGSDAAADLAAEARLAPALVALDGTADAEKVLEHVIQVVGLTPGAEVVLLRAIHGVEPPPAGPDVPEARREAQHLQDQLLTLQGGLRGEARQYLDGVAARLKERGVKTRSRVVIADQPAQAILEEAKAAGAGLIALETHGRTGLARLFMGSVADQVIRATTVPVLLHRCG
jgi:nucleotide-binding universal stress UspA family protein